MGQRFQIIENTQGKIKVYHSQWLWGDYAIRRIGTAVKNFLIYNKDSYRSFEDYLKGSFYGKPSDMNSFGRYFDYDSSWDDNKEICKSWKGKKEIQLKKKEFKGFLQTLDNNDGFFYIEFDEKWINGQKGIKGYCFILGGWRKDEQKSDYLPISAEQYMEHYKKTKGFTKKQEKEFNEGLKVFSKLEVIEPIKYIKYENEN